ncbi:MAG TPA: hypothetical protein VM674_02285 [Candidatus Acidoferrum sp.]|nr:hypothetical protein [Candidatus Acidoferrum sp.]
MALGEAEPLGLAEPDGLGLGQGVAEALVTAAAEGDTDADGDALESGRLSGLGSLTLTQKGLRLRTAHSSAWRWAPAG